MGFRFYRRMKIAPGLTVNLSRSGPSLSFGPRGAKVTAGKKGVRKTVGIPGTGLFYTEHSSNSKKKGRSRNKEEAVPSEVPVEKKLTLGFFRKLFTPDDEKDFVAGLRNFVGGRDKEAVTLLDRASHLADSSFISGYIKFKNKNFKGAVESFEKTLRLRAGLGSLFDKFGIAPTLNIAITDEITAHASPSYRGLLLGLTEAYQECGMISEALSSIRKLRRRIPDDPLLKLSEAELLLELKGETKKNLDKIIRLSAGIHNDSSIHAGLLLYKARALKSLEMYTAARDTLTAILRRRKNRSPELLKRARLERAEIYGVMGHEKRKKADLEKLYSEDPTFLKKEKNNDFAEKYCFTL
ncbi:MAG: DUF4236 domain-containing protein [Fibrobacterota bacterium]